MGAQLIQDSQNVFGRVMLETAGCVLTFTSICSSLSSLFLLLRLIPPYSIFVLGSGNQCPSCKRPSHSIHSLNGISRFGEISGQSVYAQLCQISQMFGRSRIVLGSLQNPARLWSLPCPTAQSFQPWWERSTEEWGLSQAITSFQLTRFIEPIVNSLLKLQPLEAQTEPCSVCAWRQ